MTASSLTGLRARIRSAIDGYRDETAYLAQLIAGALLWFSPRESTSIMLIPVALLLAVWSPTGTFWATCAAIPLVFHPVSIGEQDVSLLEIGLLASAAGLVARLVLDRSRLEVSEIFQHAGPLWIWAGAVALIGAGTLSLLIMPDFGHDAEAFRMLRWVIVEPLLAFTAARHAIARRGASSLVVALVAPAVVVAVFALGEFLSSQGSFQADNVTRSTATYLHPNNLALYLERILLLTAGMAAVTGRIPTNIMGVSAVFLGGGLLVTFSRGGILAIVVGLMALGWMCRRRELLVATLTGAAIALVGFGVFAGDRLTGSESSGILGTRRHLWSASIEMLRDYPISGIGLDRFLTQHNPRYIDPAAWSERYISHPHNILLDSWLSLGLPGMVLLIAAIGGLVMALLRARRTIQPFEPWRAGALAALVGGVAHGMIDNGYFLPDLAALTWILIALATDSNDRTQPIPAPPVGGVGARCGVRL